jgi:hypothetical protein
MGLFAYLAGAVGAYAVYKLCSNDDKKNSNGSSTTIRSGYSTGRTSSYHVNDYDLSRPSHCYSPQVATNTYNTAVTTTVVSQRNSSVVKSNNSVRCKKRQNGVIFSYPKFLCYYSENFIECFAKAKFNSISDESNNKFFDNETICRLFNFEKFCFNRAWYSKIEIWEVIRYLFKIIHFFQEQKCLLSKHQFRS